MAERLLEIHLLPCELTSSPYSHDLIELTLTTAPSLPIKEGLMFDELRLLIFQRVGNTIAAEWCPEIADNKHRTRLPENQLNIGLSLQIGRLING
jgi:hypothetical protein